MKATKAAARVFQQQAKAKAAAKARALEKLHAADALHVPPPSQQPQTPSTQPSRRDVAALSEEAPSSPPTRPSPLKRSPSSAVTVKSLDPRDVMMFKALGTAEHHTADELRRELRREATYPDVESALEEPTAPPSAVEAASSGSAVDDAIHELLGGPAHSQLSHVVSACKVRAPPQTPPQTPPRTPPRSPLRSRYSRSLCLSHRRETSPSRESPSSLPDELSPDEIHIPELVYTGSPKRMLFRRGAKKEGGQRAATQSGSGLAGGLS